MGARQHGITSETYKSFIIDSGAVYTGFTDFTSMGTLLGATRGGNSFTIEQEIREMEVDGAHGPVKCGRRIVMVKATLTVNFLEHTLDNLKRLIVGSESAAFNTNWDAITRNMQIEDADYLPDVTLVAEVSKKTGPCAFKLDNVITDSNFELSLTDKEEGIVAATFTAHHDPADIITEPWTIYMPNV